MEPFYPYKEILKTFCFLIVKAESHFYQQIALIDDSFCILCIGLVRQDGVINCFNYYSNHQKLSH